VAIAVNPLPTVPLKDTRIGASRLEEALPTRIMRPRRGLGSLGVAELWEYRDLLWFLMRRDIQLRYRQTLLGVTWAVLQPAATMTIFTIFFGRLAKMPSDGVPYPLFALCALVPWQLFAYALSESSNSLVTNQNLVTKIYFPRLVIPLAAVLAGLVDCCVAFGLLLLMMLYYGLLPTLAVLILPAFVLLAITTALGVGLWLAALNVQFRDVRYTLPFLTQFWFFATPIAYPSSLVSERWQPLLGLNPMAGVVEGFRWAMLGTGRPPSLLLLVSGLVSAALLYGGMLYFQRMERTFADVV
jgi:lipopolysaccharide transport system permease protein